MKSQNGWTVLISSPPKYPIRLDEATMLGLTIRGGDVGELLGHVATQFHQKVERLDMPVSEKPGYDDWGWAYRAVRGQTSGFSNHASATAMDLNATQHPRGVKNTFTKAEKAVVHRILEDTEDPVTGKPVIRWGEDYSGTIDGMHFEINADSAGVARAAKELRLKIAIRQEGLALKETDMFICKYGTQHYVVSTQGKRKISEIAANELRLEAKIPYVGNTIGAATLNEFPTFTEDGTVGGSTVTQLNKIENGVELLVENIPDPNTP